MSRLPRLSDEIKGWLEEPITLSEVEKAIDELVPAKAPGPDGMTTELYKYFKSSLSAFLLKVFQEAFRMNALPFRF